MKKIKIIVITVLAVILITFWTISCTGEGIYDELPTPTPSGSSGPTNAPVTVLTPTGKYLTEFVSANTPNIFNLFVWGNSPDVPYVVAEKLGNDFLYTWSEDVYWVESTTGNQGRVAVDTFKRQQRAPTGLITGLNAPMGLLLHRKTTDQNNLANNEDYIFVSERQDPAGGTIYRYLRDRNGVNQSRRLKLTTALQGAVTYMAFDNLTQPNFIYYTRALGSNNSALERIEAFPEPEVASPPAVAASDLNNAHGLYVYRQYIPENAKDPTTGQDVVVNPDTNLVIFVTEQATTPNGRVLCFNVTTWNGETRITPVVIAQSLQRPSKLTFIPDLQKYEVTDAAGNIIEVWGHAEKPAGYLYWTNYDPTSGQLMRARLQLNPSGKNFEIVGTPKIVAQSLSNSYDVIGPDDFRYLFIERPDNIPVSIGTKPVISTGYMYNVWKHYEDNDSDFFKRLYVSRNLEQANGGNWYEINLDKYENTPLQPGGEGVSDYITEAVPFPFNGVMQVFLIAENPNIGRVFKRDLFFTCYNFETDGNPDGIIYVQEDNFKTDF